MKAILGHIFFASFSAHSIYALVISCHGSGLCPRGNWGNPQPESITKILHEAFRAPIQDKSIIHYTDDHVFCVSDPQQITVEVSAKCEGFQGTFNLDGNIGNAGLTYVSIRKIFPAELSDLGKLRSLVDAILEQGCVVCGSVPVHFVDQESSSLMRGILTFDYVPDLDCAENLLMPSSRLGSSRV